MSIGMSHTTSSRIQVEVGVHYVARLLEDKQFQGGQIVMFPTQLLILFPRSIINYCIAREKSLESALIIAKGKFLVI